MSGPAASSARPNWLASLATLFTRVAPGRWLALMLLALHAAVVLDTEAAVMRAFLLAHYGLFLLWQPLVRSEARIEPRLAVPVFAMAALLVLVDSPWVMALWLAILAGLMGAAAASQSERGQRLAYLFALAYLLGFVWVLRTATHIVIVLFIAVLLAAAISSVANHLEARGIKQRQG